MECPVGQVPTCLLNFYTLSPIKAASEVLFPTCHLSNRFEALDRCQVVHPLHQTSLDRIPLDVSHDSIELRLVPHPMIVRLSLPEWHSRPAEDHIGCARTGALQRSGDRAQGFEWLQQHVDMVRHDNPGIQFVQGPLSCPNEQNLCHALGNAAVLEARTGRSARRPSADRKRENAGLRFGFERRKEHRGTDAPSGNAWSGAWNHAIAR